MKRWITALAVVLAVFAATAASAFAADPPVQAATQSSSTDQAAIAASSATQVQPTNQNVSVRVLSPGDDGSVSQSNEASSTANAANTASTTQTANQTLASGCGCLKTGKIDDVLAGAMGAAGAQPTAAPADAQSTAAPAAGSTQSNDAGSTGTTDNAAPTSQAASQSGSGAGGVQSTQQDASTHQKAVAASSATQVKPSNSNISVRVLSPGNDGSVDQSNEASSDANATNSAPTTQTSSQTGTGSGGVQSTTQNADTSQKAIGLSSATQIKPENSNLSVRVLSPGNGGSVSQSNEAESSANATNSAPVTQTATQNDPSSSCGCHSSSPAVQAIGQSSEIGQLGFAASSADQFGASNTSDPVRIASGGNGGSLKQENEAESSASATNTAPVTQTGTQYQTPSSCGCSSGPAVQAIGQSSEIGQLAVGLSSATQVGATNESGPIRIGSWGNDGSVSQENEAESSASATNTATPTQTGTQTQSGSGVQALGQKSEIGQGAFAASSALQLPGRSECGCGGSFGNSSDPVRIWSPGNDGSVHQENEAESNADASNTAAVTQTGTQTQLSPKCGCSGLSVQALGQWSGVHQGAIALSSAKQIGASNTSDPIRIWSYGGGGRTHQSNEADSSSTAPNVARILQTGTQLKF